MTFADLVPTDVLVFDAFPLFASIFNFLAGTINSSLDKLELLFLSISISLSLSNLVSDRVPRVSWESDLRLDKYFDLSVFSSSFPTSSSMFAKSSVSASEEVVLSIVSGIVIPSNGELGLVEFGVVDTEPFWNESNKNR